MYRTRKGAGRDGAGRDKVGEAVLLYDDVASGGKISTLNDSVLWAWVWSVVCRIHAAVSCTILVEDASAQVLGLYLYCHSNMCPCRPLYQCPVWYNFGRYTAVPRKLLAVIR